MAALPFTVKHFLVCQAVQWEGVPGPNAKRTLEGVGYRLVMEPGREPPFLLDELWFFIRLFRRTDRDHMIRFRLILKRIFPKTMPFRRVYSMTPIPLRKDVFDYAWPLRPCEFPAAGQYEFRLQYWSRTVIGLRWRTVAREFALIEEQR